MLEKLAEDIESGAIIVPLPPSVIATYGCRPGTVIRMNVSDGKNRAIPDQDPTVIGTRMPPVTNIAEACWQWWKSQR